MGLSTASVRHPHVMVMAPALTKTSQARQNFNLPPHSPSTESTTPISSRNECNVYRSLEADCKNKSEFKARDIGLNRLALVSELFINKKFPVLGESSIELDRSGIIMNSSPPHMGDQIDDKMGLQKAGLEVSTLLKDKVVNNDIDQLFNNLPSGPDIGQNMDEIIQVIKSIESGSDKLGIIGSDIGPESDSLFPLPGTDLTSNLSSFENDLLNDVDVMNITMEEQFLDSANSLKEDQSKEIIKDLEKKQVKLQRKLEYVLRRLRKIQAKSMGQHVSEEVAGIFEHVHRTLRRVKDNSVSGEINHLNTLSSERLKPISQSSAKNLVRKLEMSANMQANASGRQRHLARYFGSGSVETSSLRSALMGATTIPPWTPECRSELQRVVGSLYAENRLLQEEIDSEATVSSSGGESCDELQAYNNPHQQYLSIQKRAAWKYATKRAAIASRWAWLQAQIADLEYKIRQYSDLHKSIRANKGAIQLGGVSPPRSESTSPSAVNGYRGQLPGASLSSKNSAGNESVSQAGYSCCRTRPLLSIQKRKLLQTWGLHAVSKKAARPSTIRCGCVPPSFQCALCTGRTDPTRPRDIADYLSKSERISLLDPSFHPVFSLPEDISTGIHLEAIMKTPEWQHRSTRPSIKTLKFVNKSERLDKNNIGMLRQPKKPLTDHRRKYSRLLKSSTISALTAKLKHKFRGRKPGLHSLARLKRNRHAEKLALRGIHRTPLDVNIEDMDSSVANSTIKMESPSTSPLLPMQSISGYKRNNRITSFDIDNIVIPYSVAAATRVEKLPYKEILTPKWRMIDSEIDDPVNGVENAESDSEDCTEETIISRHDRCEQDERKRFLSYLKFPYGYGRARSHKRTDSRAESSGGNTPDRMSPHFNDIMESVCSPIASPPPMIHEDPLPSLSILRRRTMSQSLRGKDKEVIKEDKDIRSVSPDTVEVIPFEKRTFPITAETYEKMLKFMPENHQFKTNIRSQDCGDPPGEDVEERVNSPDSESTESALGDEDPNDPEWIDQENIKERYRR